MPVVVSEEFDVACEGRAVPVALWHPELQRRPLPLVLLGHGGSQHKTAPSVLELVGIFVGRHGFAAMAIDGPIHGARRQELVTGPQRQREFLDMWARETHVQDMVADWRAALEHVLARGDVDPAELAWCGVSMGTAYGIPVLAAEARIRAAVLGMWGGDHPNSSELSTLASDVRCPVLFQMKWNDHLFSREGQFELFDRLGSDRKWLKAYPGEHTPLVADQLDDIEAFLIRHLS